MVCPGPCEWLKCLWIFLVPSWSFNTPFYPQSVMSQGARPNFVSFYYSLLGSQLNPLKSLGVRQWQCSNSCIHQRCLVLMLTWSYCWNKFAHIWSWICDVIQLLCSLDFITFAKYMAMWELKDENNNFFVCTIDSKCTHFKCLELCKPIYFKLIFAHYVNLVLCWQTFISPTLITSLNHQKILQRC